MGQLQKELVAQQQLQAISAVLLPGTQTVLHGPSQAVPLPHQSHLVPQQLQPQQLPPQQPQPSQSSDTTAEELRAIRELLASIQSEKTSSSREEPTRNSVPQESLLVAELAKLQNEIAGLKAQGATPSETGKAQKPACRPKRRSDTLPSPGDVTKADHSKFFRELLGKRCVMARVESMPLAEWAEVQSQKLGDADFDCLMEKLDPPSVQGDEPPADILAKCMEHWRATQNAPKAGN